MTSPHEGGSSSSYVSAAPRAAPRLSELLETYGGVSGDWTEGLECAGLSIGKARLDRPLRALFNRMLDAKRKEPFTPVSVVRLVGRSHDTLEDVAEALLLDCGGVVFREDGSSLTYVPVPKTKTPKPSTKKITKKIFDGSIPEEVEARFGHEQGAYKLGCRDPITVKLPAVVKAVGVKGKFGFSDGGDGRRRSVTTSVSARWGVVDGPMSAS